MKPTITALIIVGAVAANLILLAAAVLAAPALGVGPAALYLDTAAAAGVGFATGWLSNLGAALWFSGASALLVAAAAARGGARRSLASLGALTALLGADDLFMIHDGLMPYLGLPDELVYLLFLVPAAVWIRRPAHIAATPWAILVAALVCLSMSLGMDVAADRLDLAGVAESLIEDALQLTGVTLWSTYAAVTALIAVRRAASAEPLRGPIGRPWNRRDAPAASSSPGRGGAGEAVADGLPEPGGRDRRDGDGGDVRPVEIP